MATLDEQPTCINHPDTPTGLSCSKCLRPICQKCAVRTPVGLRCADCTGARRTGSGQWYVPAAMELVSGRQYWLAALAALGVAIVGGLAWGQWRLAGEVASYADLEWSFWWAALVTLAAGEAVGRAAQERRSSGLQALAAVSVLLAAVIALVWNVHHVLEVPLASLWPVLRDRTSWRFIGLNISNGLFVAMGMFVATRRLRM